MLNWDSTGLDRSLKRGLGDALQYLISERSRGSQPFNDLHIQLLNVCARVLHLSILDGDWRRLGKVFNAVKKHFGPRAGRP